MATTFIQHLLENTYEEEQSKQDLSGNSDDELVDWVINDEGLYNLAGSVQSFDELMDTIDSIFLYNNDQYNVLARAFRRGELNTE